MNRAVTVAFARPSSVCRTRSEIERVLLAIDWRNRSRNRCTRADSFRVVRVGDPRISRQPATEEGLSAEHAVEEEESTAAVGRSVLRPGSPDRYVRVPGSFAESTEIPGNLTRIYIRGADLDSVFFV